MSEVFEGLSEEKRIRIINAAMEVFAMHGYHKTSVSDIARVAEISKAMVFTYFGTKHGCYAYMSKHLLKVAFEEFSKYKDEILAETDFFERIILAVKIKIEIFKHYPSLLSFATSFMTERDEDVREIIAKTLKEGFELRAMFLSVGIDSAKFKNPDDAERVNKMAEWLSMGCADEWSRSQRDKLDALLDQFVDCMMMLKKQFYKEEYL